MKHSWEKLVADYVERFHHDVKREPRLVLNAPATQSELAFLSDFWGVAIPPEIESFYSTSNGYGYAYGNCQDVTWTFPPIDQLPVLLDLVRDSAGFFDAAPKLAERFLPFRDLYPDGVGLFLSETGSCGPEIWYFQQCEFVDWIAYDPDSEECKYLYKYANSLRDYLEPF